MFLVWLDNILNLNSCFPCFMQEGKGSVRTLVIMWSSSHPWDSLTRVVIDLPKRLQDTRFSFVIGLCSTTEGTLVAWVHTQPLPWDCADCENHRRISRAACSPEPSIEDPPWWWHQQEAISWVSQLLSDTQAGCGSFNCIGYKLGSERRPSSHL